MGGVDIGSRGPGVCGTCNGTGTQIKYVAEPSQPTYSGGNATSTRDNDAVRAHSAWLIFNDGLILPGTGLPAVTLELLRLLEDTHPGQFELSCHDGNAVVATLRWPLQQTASAFENFEQSYVRSGVEFATQKLLECIPFSPETAQFRRVADQLERWAEAQDAVLVTGRRTTLVRAALAKIGGTAHFTTIAREAATIANEPSTVAYEHNVHVVLRLYTDVFARPGGRGMYALVADGIATTDGLAEEMRKILAGVNGRMSAQRIWQALPLGNRFTLPSVTMTAGQFPFFSPYNELRIDSERRKARTRPSDRCNCGRRHVSRIGPFHEPRRAAPWRLGDDDCRRNRRGPSM